MYAQSMKKKKAVRIKPKKTKVPKIFRGAERIQPTTSYLDTGRFASPPGRFIWTAAPSTWPSAGLGRSSARSASSCIITPVLGGVGSSFIMSGVGGMNENLPDAIDENTRANQNLSVCAQRGFLGRVRRRNSKKVLRSLA